MTMILLMSTSCEMLTLKQRIQYMNHGSNTLNYNEYFLPYIIVGTLPQLIGFIRFGEPVPHGLSARPRVWAGPTKG